MPHVRADGMTIIPNETVLWVVRGPQFVAVIAELRCKALGLSRKTRRPNENKPRLERTPTMRRAVIGTLAGWVAGAVGLFAQTPMMSPPSPYSSYSLRSSHADSAAYDDAPRVGATQYSPVMPVAYGPAPVNGPANSPAYGPVMNAGGLQPPAG